MSYSLSFSQSLYIVLFVASKIEQKTFEFISTQQIADTLSLDERVELARLTQAMRRAVDSEANLPMEGARKLHGKLQELRTRDQELRHHPR